MKRKGLVLAAAFTASMAAVNVVMVPSLMARDEVTTEREISGRFLLSDHDGRKVTDESFDGYLRLMAFGYTFCPDVCPTALSTMGGAMDLLGAEAGQVVPMFVSVDPQRDTPAHLKEYVGAFGPRFIGMTGSRAEIDAAARSFKVTYVIHPPKAGDDPDTYVVDHSAGIYIMGRKGQFLARMAHTATAADVAERVRQIIKRGG